MRKSMVVMIAVALCGGCAKSIKPEAEPILIVANDPGGKCERIGDVQGQQGNAFTGFFTENADLELGARNDLKNKAFARGGNVIVISTESVSENGIFGKKSVSVSGTAYKCPSWR